ncbi:unnamed protein product [Paramecium sonneborni]|uniref:Endoplasmic reticulum oxidoreductin 1 n=1 Tax=Paramecium sonneborni TaxID=65129 RepID=A0A8S1KIX8_9CILI|nr:unnamed protein product [Paramecium sonneborni]
MITGFLQILLALNLVAIFMLSYNYSISQKEIVYNSNFSQDNLENIYQIEEINNVLFPILNDLQNESDFFIYRYTDTLLCPIYLHQEECEVESCNFQNFPGEDSINTVNLKYVGEKYKGQHGQMVWFRIYEDLGNNTSSKIHAEMMNFIKAIHQSISISIDEQFDYDQVNGPKIDFFLQRVGYYPDRIKNLYFLEQILIKALNFIRPNHELQSSTSLKVQNLQSSYNQMALSKFDPLNKLTEQDLEQYRNDIKLLDSYLDCVHCKKCKFNGKLQIHGLNTAVNLLFYEKEREQIEKNDLVAFFNTFYKISNSVKQLDAMFERITQILYQYIKLASSSFAILSLLSSVVLLLKK